MSGGCLDGALRMSRRCLKGFWSLSEGKVAWRVSGRFQIGAHWVGVKRVSGGYKEGLSEGHPPTQGWSPTNLSMVTQIRKCITDLEFG